MVNQFIILLFWFYSFIYSKFLFPSKGPVTIFNFLRKSNIHFINNIHCSCVKCVLVKLRTSLSNVFGKDYNGPKSDTNYYTKLVFKLDYYFMYSFE